MISTHMRRRRKPIWALMLVAAAALLLAGSTTAFAMGTDGGSTTNPWIQSDQADYAPGATVTLTGGNWAPGESVHVFVDDSNGHTWNHSADVTADDMGLIQDVFQLPNTFVSDYDVTATGAVSGSAATTFTDGNLQGASLFLFANDCATAPTAAATGDSLCAHSVLGAVTGQGNGALTVQVLNPTSAVVNTFNHSGNTGDSFDDHFSVNAAGTWTVRDCSNSSCGQVLTSKTVSVRQAQTITLAAPAAKTFGDGDVDPGATASSGLAVTYAAGPSTVCTIVAGKVHLVGVGSCSITASQAGNTTFAPAPDVTRQFTVNQAASTTTVTCAPSSVVFTGTAQTPCTATVTGAGGLSQSLSVTYANNVSVGSATATASFAGDANHTGSNGSASFAITKATPSVSVTWTGWTFDGTAHPASGSVSGVGTPAADLGSPDSFTYYSGSTATGTPLPGAPSGAGTYTVVAHVNATANYTAADSAAKTVTVAKATPLVTASWTGWTFDGTAHAASGSVSGVGTPAADLGSPDSFTYYSGSTATGTPLPGAPSGAGTYAVVAHYNGGPNYLPADSAVVSVVVAKAASVTKVTCPDSVVYTGDAKTPCSAGVTGAGGLKKDLDVTYGNNSDATTDASPATAAASYDGDANHTGSNDATTFAIAKAASMTAVTCPDSVVYNGDAQQPCSAQVTGAGGLKKSLDVTYGNNTDATSYADPATAAASYDGDANHTGSNDATTFAIAKAASVTAVTCPDSVVYSGDARKPCTAEVTGAGGLKKDLEVTYGNNTDATRETDPATAAASYDGDANHTGSNDSTTFAIDKAVSVTKVACPDSVVYSGSEQKPCSAEVTGAGGLKKSLAVTYGNNTDATSEADPATAAASYDGDANHTDSNDSAAFAIAKAASVTAVDCPKSVTYTGSALTPCTAGVTGVGGLDKTLGVTYGNNTDATGDADPATAAASYDGDANHTGSQDSATFGIDKAASVTAVTCPDSVVYDGSEQKPCSAKVTGAGGLEKDLAVSYGNNTDATTDADPASAAASYDGDPNHTGSNDSTAFAIAKAASVTTVTCPDSVIYSGDAKTPCSAGVTGAGGLDKTLDVIYGNNTDATSDADPATAAASYDGDANHTGSSGAATFAITKAPSVTVVTCPKSVTYTGSELTPCTAGVTGAGGLDKPLAVTYGNNTDATSDADPATAAASYDGDANHTGSSDATTFAIAKAPSATKVTCATSVVYDGSEQKPCSAEVTGVGGLDKTLSVSYSDNVDAGTGAAAAQYDGDANHTGSQDSATFGIDKAPSVTTLTCPKSVVYSGDPQEPCSAGVTGAGGLDKQLDVIYGNNTDATSDTEPATAAAVYDGDANHTGSNDSASFAIDRAPSATKVTCPDSVVYDGDAKTPCTAMVTGVGGLKKDLGVTYGNNTDATTDASLATAAGSYDGDANHTGSSDSTSFAISRAPSVTKVSCPDSVVYSGAAKTPCSALVTGAGGLDTKLDVTYGNNLDATSDTEPATAAASYDGDPNHMGSKDSATFAITRAPTVTAVACPTSVTYTGSALTPCRAEVTGAGGLDKTLAVTYGKNTDATTDADPATAGAAYEGDPNHTGSNDATTFAIAQAASVTKVSCPVGVTYTGSALTPCTAQVTGAGGLKTNLVVTYDSNTDAGTASAGAHYDGDANHLPSQDSATFSVDRAGSAITVTCPDSVTYSGTAQEPCTARVEGAGGLDSSVPVSYSSNTGAGTANANASYDGDSNHLGSAGAATFAIAKATPKVAVAWSGWTFDGTAHGASGAVTGVGTPAAKLGDPTSFSYTGGSTVSGSAVAGTPVNAGTYTVVAHFAGSANYTSADSDPATVVVGKAVPAVSVGWSGWTFDGTVHAASGGVTGVGSPAAVLGNPDTFLYYTGGSAVSANALAGAPKDAGSYTVVAHFNGSANYTAADSAPQTVTVDRATPAVTATWTGWTYDGTAHVAAGTVKGVGSAYVGTPSSFAYYSGTTGTGTALAGAPKDTGTYAVIAHFNGNGNYKPADSPATSVTVTKAMLTVTAPSPTITFGQPTPALTPGYSGFATGEGASRLATAPACSAPAVTGAGPYTVTCAGGVDGNYAFTYVAGKMTVLYRWDGFLQPINDTAHQIGLTESQFKLGSTVPVKFQLKKADGTVVQEGGSNVPTFTRSANQGSCDATTSAEGIDSDPGFTGSAFRYDSTAGQYIYNFSTKGLAAGEYRIFASLDDGTRPWVDICLR